jgi:hypothetical protein
VRNGAGMRVGSGNVFSRVPAKETKEMQGSTAAVPGGAPVKAKYAAEMFSPLRACSIYLIARVGSGVVSRSALLKGGYGTRQGGKQRTLVCRRSSGMRSSLMQGELLKGLAGVGEINPGEGCCFVWFG